MIRNQARRWWPITPSEHDPDRTHWVSGKTLSADLPGQGIGTRNGLDNPCSARGALDGPAPRNENRQGFPRRAREVGWAVVHDAIPLAGATRPCSSGLPEETQSMPSTIAFPRSLPVRLLAVVLAFAAGPGWSFAADKSAAP